MTSRWTIVASTLATQTAQAGLLIYGFSALALPLEEEFGVSRFEVMLSATCLSLVSSALGPITGRWVDRGSVRLLMMAGAIALGLGLALVSFAQAIWQVWLAYALILPFANVMLGQLTSASLVTRWFTDMRGRAMGISTVGTSLGGFVFPILLSATAQDMGWRLSLLLIATITSGIATLVIVFGIADPPQPVRKDGAAQVETDGGLSMIQILSRAAFWIITLAIGVKLATYVGLINNLTGFAAEIEVDRVAAAGMISVLAANSMAGKLIFGALAERFAPRDLLIVSLVLTIAGFGLLLLAFGFWALLIACILLGLSTGGVLPLWNLIVAQYFGTASFGRALGLTSLAMVPLTAGAPPMAGWLFDRTGSYDGVIWGSMAVLLLSIALLLSLRKVTT